MSSQDFLFDRSEFERTNTPAEANAAGGTPRLRHAVRDQYIVLPGTIDDLLAADHQAEARQSEAGAPPADAASAPAT